MLIYGAINSVKHKRYARLQAPIECLEYTKISCKIFWHSILQCPYQQKAHTKRKISEVSIFCKPFLVKFVTKLQFTIGLYLLQFMQFYASYNQNLGCISRLSCEKQMCESYGELQLRFNVLVCYCHLQYNQTLSDFFLQL